MSLTTLPVTSVAEYNSSANGLNPAPSETQSTSIPLVRAGSAAPPSPVSKDLSALLKDLASGDIQKSSQDLLKLKQDLKAQQSPEVTTFDPFQRPSEESLQNVVSTISNALDSGSAEKALAGLSTYLVESGHSSGTAVKTAV